MSFSPTIDTVGYVYANIFAESGYTTLAGPLPNYYRPIPAGEADSGGEATGGFVRILEDNGELAEPGLDLAKNPFPFPTLKTITASPGFIPNPSSVAYAFGYDYLRLWTASVHTSLPPVTPESSGFLSWDHGFGFGVNQELYGYYHGDPGGADIGPTEVNFSDYYSDTLGLVDTDSSVAGMSSVIKVYGYNCEDVFEYFEQELSTSPYHSFYFIHDVYGTGASYPESMAEADSVPIKALDQVLYSTKVDSLVTHENIVFKPDGSWASAPVSTYQSRFFRTYPKVSRPRPTSDGFTGDLMLYEAKLVHSYSLYNYVKQDIRERFVTQAMNTIMRNDFIGAKVTKYNNLLGSTFKIPRDYRTKRQPSPKTLRQNYTSFGTDLTTQIGTDTTSTTAGPTGGGSSGGSY